MINLVCCKTFSFLLRWPLRDGRLLPRELNYRGHRQVLFNLRLLKGHSSLSMRTDVSPQDFVKPRSPEIRVCVFAIALKAALSSACQISDRYAHYNIQSNCGFLWIVISNWCPNLDGVSCSLSVKEAPLLMEMWVLSLRINYMWKAYMCMQKCSNKRM